MISTEGPKARANKTGIDFMIFLIFDEIVKYNN